MRLSPGSNGVAAPGKTRAPESNSLLRRLNHEKPRQNGEACSEISLCAKDKKLHASLIGK